jgi:GTPase
MAKLPSEPQEGNIEYKRTLSKISSDKIKQQATQLQWRITESTDCTAKYYLGVEDNGEFSHISKDEVLESIESLSKIGDIVNARVSNTTLIPTDKEDCWYAIVDVENKPIKRSIPEVRIALIGLSESGKSSTLGVLSYGQLDDGDGLSRTNVFRHEHEIYTGITSSISEEIVGIKKGKFVNYSKDLIDPWGSVFRSSDSIITFIDLPGSAKYIKSTIYGISSYKPDYLFLIMDANEDPRIHNNHLSFCFQCNIPFFVGITKIDLLNKQQKKEYFDILNKIIPSIRIIRTATDINILDPSKHTYIIPFSNVTGEGIELLQNIIHKLPICEFDTKSKDPEFVINETFYLPEVGNIVSGILVSGCIDIDSSLLLGSFDNKLISVNVCSIHKKQVPCSHLVAGESASLLITSTSDIRDKIQKTMLLFHPHLIKHFTKKIDIVVTHKPKNIVFQIGSQYYFYQNNQTSPVTITSIRLSEENEIFLGLEAQKEMYIKEDYPMYLRQDINYIKGMVV